MMGYDHKELLFLQREQACACEWLRVCSVSDHMHMQTMPVGVESVCMHIEQGWVRVCEGERVSTQ